MSCTAPAHLSAASDRLFAEMMARRAAEPRPASAPQSVEALLAEMAARIAASPADGEARQ